jgi:hypothetical protein
MKRSEIPRDSGAVVGCYSVHLYCQYPEHRMDFVVRDEVPHHGEFVGETEAYCLSIARDNGWWISRYDADFRRAVLCPYHAREVRR